MTGIGKSVLEPVRHRSPNSEITFTQAVVLPSHVGVVGQQIDVPARKVRRPGLQRTGSRSQVAPLPDGSGERVRVADEHGRTRTRGSILATGLLKRDLVEVGHGP